MEITKEMLFWCYDIELHLKLKNAGSDFLTSAISNSGRRFWLYSKSKELSGIVTEHYNSRQMVRG